MYCILMPCIVQPIEALPLYSLELIKNLIFIIVIVNVGN